MTLPRPRHTPRKIPLSWWYYDAWIRGGRRAPRPKSMPKRVPAAFWLWRLWRLARAKGKGSKAWRQYLEAIHAQPDPQKHLDEARAAVVRWARWGAAHEPEIGYTEGPARDDFLHEPVAHLPFETDCSGDATYNHWAPGLPDISGLDYRYLGFTGTILANAAKNGRILTDVSLARPGDPIVIGPGTGWHVVTTIEEGPDPLVVSHGDPSGPKIQRLSIDTREPKRVCQILI